MKKLLLVAILAMLAFGLDSCQKHKYCQCFAFIDGEDVPLGEDLPGDPSNMTASTLDSLDSSYNLYVIEHGTCNDKAKEIVGWGQVTCREVDPKYDSSWLTNLFNKNKNK